MEKESLKSSKSGKKPQTTYSLRDDVLNSTTIAEELSQKLEELKAPDSPLQLEVVYRINAKSEQIYEYISNDDNLPHWGSGVFNCKHDNTNAATPGGVGAVRIVNEGVFQTSEKIVYKTYPMYCYALCSDLFGYSNHLCAWICQADGDGTLLVVRTYATEVGNVVTNWTGKKIFIHCEKDGMKNLGKRKWNLDEVKESAKELEKVEKDSK